MSEPWNSDQNEERRVFRVHPIVLVGPILATTCVAVATTLGVGGFLAFSPEAPERYAALGAVAALGLTAWSSTGIFKAIVRRETAKLTVFVDRAVWSFGLVSNYSRTAQMDSVVGVDVVQTAFERVLGCGTLRIEMQGVGRIACGKVEDAPEAARVLLWLAKRARCGGGSGGDPEARIARGSIGRPLFIEGDRL